MREQKIEGYIYIYSLADPETNQIRYVGKTNNLTKRFNGHNNKTGTARINSWITSLKRKNTKPIMEVIDLVSECNWQFWEKHYISLFRSWGFDLVNHREGGEGELIDKNTKRTPWNKGKKTSAEVRQKMKDSLKKVDWSWRRNKPRSPQLQLAVEEYIRLHGSGARKLTMAQAEEIRVNSHLKRRELASKYNVTIRTIYRILGNNSYKQQSC